MFLAQGGIMLRIARALVAIIMIGTSAVLTAACTPTDITLTESFGNAKQLATVVISPTPIGQQATRAPLASATAIVSAPTATVYVGSFLGEARFGEGGFGLVPASARQATPTPVIIASRICATPIDAIFGTTWSQAPATAQSLGCPIQQMFGVQGRVQVFERGVMYRRTDTTDIWAITLGNSGAGQYWYVATPPAYATVFDSAPAGLFTPATEFLPLWAGLPEVRAALGFARTTDQPAPFEIQRMDGGTLFRDTTVGQVFVLFNDGTALGPY
jgi:hypothetical protein